MDVESIITQAGPLWQHRAEFSAFCAWLVAHKVESVLEIGTGVGGSAYVFGELTNHGKVVTLDSNLHTNPSNRRSQPNPHFTQVIGDSRNPEIEAAISLFAPFDLVYFDTEHPYDLCADNWARYGKFASRFIAQHDINMDEVNWPDAGIPQLWRERKVRYDESVEFIDPAPDPRFPRWGGLGVVIL